MQEIEQGIYINNGYLGITLGALISPHGALLVDAPPHPEVAFFGKLGEASS